MSRESLIVLLGVCLFFIPHLGIPEVWRQYAVSTVGVVVIIIGYSLRRSAFHRRLERSAEERGTDSFVENAALPRRQTPAEVA
jgi:hypothetical protein